MAASTKLASPAMTMSRIGGKALVNNFKEAFTCRSNDVAECRSIFSNLPERSPKFTTCTSKGGNKPDRSSGSAIGRPARTSSWTLSIASAKAAFPSVSFVMLNPSRIGNPADVRVPSVLVNLVTATSRRSGPKRGIRNLKRSNFNPVSYTHLRAHET